MAIDTQFKRRGKKAIIWLAIVFLCLLSIIYLRVFPAIDYDICTNNVANRFGVEHNRASIMKHIEEEFRVGMSPSEVHTILYKNGNVIKITTKGSREIARLRMCTHPVNDFMVFVYYDNRSLREITVSSVDE